MQYIFGTTDIEQKENSIVILGNFDGVHIGHQKLFEAARERAQLEQLTTVVFSFYPHPTWVIGKCPKALLMSRTEKVEVIKTLNIDILIEYPFTEAFACVSAETFFVDILVNQLKAKVIIVGSNYYFGKNKEGNQYSLHELGKKYNIEVHVVNTVKLEGEVISSSMIRHLVASGNIEKANKLLGHTYAVIGTVIKGKMLGRTIGFPTINIAALPDRIYPPNGVYATKIKVYNKEYLGMTNIGYNPTVNGTNKMIETHLFDFDKDVYGEEMKVSFFSFIRPEQKFKDIASLAAQIEKDKLHVQKFFKSYEK